MVLDPVGLHALEDLGVDVSLEAWSAEKALTDLVGSVCIFAVDARRRGYCAWHLRVNTVPNHNLGEVE